MNQIFFLTSWCIYTELPVMYSEPQEPKL